MPKSQLKNFRYAHFAPDGSRMGTLTFVAETQREADTNALAWVKSAQHKGESVKRIKERDGRRS